MSDVYAEFEALEFIEFDDNLGEVLEDISYQGFNAEILLKKIKDITPIQGTAKDITIMVVAGLMRGNNLDKMVKKMSADGAKLMNSLKKAYDLKTKAKSSDALTLSRMVSLFPGIACSFADSKQKSFPVSPGMLQTALGVDIKIPTVLCCPAFGNIIPSFETLKSMKMSPAATVRLTKAFCIYQAALSVVLSRTKDKQTPLNRNTIKEQLPKVYTFVSVAVGAEYPTQETRFKILAKYPGVCGIDGGVLKNTKNISKLADLYDEMMSSRASSDEEESQMSSAASGVKKSSNREELDL